MRTTTRLGVAAEYAKDHYDLLPTEVLRRAGLGSQQITDLRRDGLIERVIRGLYRLAGSRTPLQDIAASLQRHRDGAAASVSALYVHGLDVTPPSPPMLLLPPGSTSRSRLGVLRRSPLERVDRTRRQRLPVTTLPRAIVDAAGDMTVEPLAHVVNEAVSRRMVTIPQILDAARRVEAAPGRLGSGRLRAVLATWTDEIQPDSVAEAAAIRRIRSFGLPEPVTQHVVEDGDGEFVARLDMAWPGQHVAREYQSVQWHRPDRIEPDEGRLQAVEGLGWSVEPLFRYQLHPAEVEWLQTLAADLDTRRSAAS